MINMLKYELKKLWNRPLVYLTLIGILFIHIFFICTNQLQYYHDENLPYFEKYEGKMSETWKVNTMQKYNDYINDPAHQMNDEQFNEYAKTRNWSTKKTERLASDPNARLLEEYKYSSEFNVLSSAYNASHFKENIIEFKRVLKQDLLMKYPDIDTSIVDSAYSDLLENTENFTFSMDYGYSMMEGVTTIMIRSFVILMIVILASLFTRDQETLTLETILTTKNGRRKNQKIKYIAAILSSIIGWCVIIIVSLLSVYFTLGFDGGNMFVQEFNFSLNTSPYNLNSAQFMICTLAISFCASITIGACLALISAISKKDYQAVILCFVIMLIPPFFNNSTSLLQTLLFFHPSNFVSGSYLINAFHIIKIGNHYMPSLLIVGGCVIFCILLSYIFIYFRKPETYLFHCKDESE